MSINLKIPDLTELKPRITVFGVGGAGGNAVNNMIQAGLQGVEFVVANTDAQALTMSRASRIVQMGVAVTEGLGAGSQPEVGRAAAEEVIDEINDHLAGSHMVFVTAGMGGGTGTGAAPVVARAAREMGILTVGVVTKPFQFEGKRRMRIADAGIDELSAAVDTLICIPNQNLFRIANERTTFADAFAMADQVLYSGVACITDLMVKEGLINLDFADVRSIMRGMGKAMMGTGEASGEKRAITAAEAAIANPLLDETTMKGARGLLISITGGKDLTLFEVDEAATRIREEVDQDANIIVGATFDDALEGVIRVSVVATGIDQAAISAPQSLGGNKSTDLRSTTFVSQNAAQAAANVAARRNLDAAQRAPESSTSLHAIERELELPHAQAFAPVAAAQDPQVTLESVRPHPTMVEHPRTMMEPDMMHGHAEHHEPAPAPYVPPAPMRPTLAQPPRMPSIDDFSPVVRDEFRQKVQGEAPAHDDKGAFGFLKRVVSSGLGLREEEHGQVQPQAPRQMQRPAAPPAPAQPLAQRPQAPTQRPMSAAPQARPTSDYAKRPADLPRGAAGQLDPHGRPAPQARMNEEDHLEIPAFLRRSPN